MSWHVEYSPKARKSLMKLERQSQERIMRWIDEHIDGCENPRAHGKALVGERLWRYRVGDYRVICDIQDGKLTVYAVKVEHRSKVYTDR